MEPSDWISIGALSVALASFVGQLISNQKSNRATKKSNEIQTETYRLSKKIDDFENRKGEILLLNIIGRYFVIQLNCWEPDGPLKKDQVSIENYKSELKQLSNDFNELINNPFYIKFIENHPDINLLIITLRGNIIEREFSNDMAVNPLVFDHFYNIYNTLKEEIKGNEILSHQFFKSCDDACEFLKKEIKKMRSKK